ncbi:MAG: septum formation protein Maf [Firmicutes bacterium]|nr:septum formation protein Maf [Bacillota bacterium]
MKLFLASASPRRAALLGQVGIPFEVVESGLLAESRPRGPVPAEAAVQLALEKARLAAAAVEQGIVLGADTIVLHRGEILGKPRDRDEACRMLERLSGEEHLVITGIALVDVRTACCECGFAETRVWMRVLEPEMIEAYVATGEPMDKAGAYGIQGKAALFVERIEGSYFNVVGLPLYQLSLLLSRMGIKPWSGWRESDDGREPVDDQGSAHRGEAP